MSSGTTSDLFAIWGSGGSNVFAVGASGTILRFDGATWNALASGTSNVLYSVWGSSANHVFAVGAAGVILHFDGANWTPMISGTDNALRGVWGTSADNVYAVGDQGAILHYDGANWQSMESRTDTPLRSIWGNSASSIFAVGKNSLVLHYDGSAWNPMSTPLSAQLTGVWGSSAEDVYAVGDYQLYQGFILHYTGQRVFATLSTHRAGSGWGRVTSTPVGIDWWKGDSGYAHVYDVGTVVTLTAMPEVPAIFDSWSGDCTGIGHCAVIMNMPRDVTATFTLLTIFPHHGDQNRFGEWPRDQCSRRHRLRQCL